jgi:type IV pilus assembly protein PilW
MNHSSEKHCAARLPGRKQNGFSLVELLVALTIGGILIFGATQAYVDSRNAYAINETVARMQETARYAVSVMEPDLRAASYWGLVKGSERITGKVAQTAAPASLGGALVHNCGPNYALDLEYNIQGSEAAYSAGCAALNGNAMPAADTITIRRVAVTPVVLPAANGPLRVCSTRSTAVLVTDLSNAGCDAANAVEPAGQVNDLVVNLYYVDKDSDQQNGLPSLRRQSLTVDATPTFKDNELIAGVEDMQIQYGVDPTGGLGAKGGAATQYLNAGATLDALLKNAVSPAQIVSVRIWLLVRTDTPEAGFTDDRVYEYGSRLAANGTTGDLTSTGANAIKAYKPSLSADNSFTSVKRYRRVLVSRTIQVRNALGT